MNIQIHDRNIFEEKSKVFMSSKYASRLQDKYQPKPFEEDYLLLYYVALVTSYFANVLSALTASTWVFTYVYSIVFDLPYPFIIGCGFTGIVLLGLEALQRFLAQKFFKTKLQYGYTQPYRTRLNTIFMGMIIIAALSITFSFLGGFDLVKTVTSPPSKQVAVLQDVEPIKNRYQGMIDEADKTANDYFDRRKYRGRIATEDAKKYQEYLDKKIAYQDSMLLAVSLVERGNERVTAKADTDYRAALLAHENKTKSQGSGLGIAAVCFIILLYVSLWFMEFYDYKTATQYASIAASTPTGQSKPSNPSGQNLDAVIQELQSHIEQLQQQSSKTFTPPAPTPNGSENGQSNGVKNMGSLPIGFFNEQMRQEQVQNLYKHHIQPYIQHTQTNRTVYDDCYTIEHNNFKTGKLEHLDIGTVTNRIGIYIGKIHKSLGTGNLHATLNQLDKLNYWKDKRDALLSKIQAVGT